MDQQIGNLINALDHFTSTDAALRAPAIQYLDNFKADNPLEFLYGVSQVLLLDDIKSSVVNNAMVLMGSIMRPTVDASIEMIAQGYFRVDPEARTQIKQALMRSIMFPELSIRTNGAHALCRLIQIELSQNAWPDVFENFKQILESSDYTYETKHAVFLVLTNLFQSSAINPSHPTYTSAADITLTASVSFINDAVPNIDFKIDVLKCLRTALPIFENVYVSPEASNAIYGVVDIVLDAIPEVEHEDFAQTVYDLAAEFSKMVYNRYLESYINVIFEQTLRDIQSGNPISIVAAISFWDTIARFEYHVKLSGRRERKRLIDITQSVAPQFYSLLLSILAQPEDPDMYGQYSPQQAARTCLESFARVAPEAVLELTYTYFGECWNEGNAIPALCSLAPVAIIRNNQASDFLLEVFQRVLEAAAMEDPSIRLYGLIVLKLIIDKQPDVICSIDDYAEIVRVALASISGEMNLAKKAFEVLRSFFDLFDPQAHTNFLSDRFDVIYEAFTMALSRADIREEFFGKSVFDSLSKFASKAPQSCLPQFIEILDQLRSIIAQEDTALTGPICLVIGSIFLRYKNDLDQYNTETVELILSIIEKRGSSFDADIMNGISEVLLSTPPEAIQNYIAYLVPLVKEALAHSDINVKKAATIMTGDFFRNVPQLVEAHAVDFYNLLFANFDERLDMHPETIATLADFFIGYDPENTVQFRDRYVNVLLDHVARDFPADDEFAIDAATEIYEDLFIGFGAVIKCFGANDVEFVLGISPAVFRLIQKANALPKYKPSMLRAFLYVFEALIDYAGRLINIKLNHYTCRNLLQKAQSTDMHQHANTVVNKLKKV